MRKLRNALGIAVVALMALAGNALADFSPQFTLDVSNKTVKGHPALNIHLEFDAEDEEIGNFIMDFPKGYGVAADAKVPDDEEIGSGSVTIEGGPGCNPAGEGLPTAPVTLTATIFEKARYRRRSRCRGSRGVAPRPRAAEPGSPPGVRQQEDRMARRGCSFAE